MSQEKQILHYLATGKSLTPLESLRLFDCLRLSARILSLREAGHNIQCTLKKTKTGKHVGSYRLIK